MADRDTQGEPVLDPAEVGAWLTGEQLAAGAHRKPEQPEDRLPQQLDVGQREAAYHAVGEAIRELGKLSSALAASRVPVTDAAFAAAVAEVVVPLEHAAREACRHD